MKISLEVEFYLVSSTLEKVQQYIRKNFKFPFAIVEEIGCDQYEICSNELTIDESIVFVNDLQELLFYMNSIYSLPFFKDGFSPNGLHVNFISESFTDAQYVYSLADFLCLNIELYGVKNLLKVSRLNFIDRNVDIYRNLIQDLAIKRFNSDCIYAPKALLFSHRFNRSVAIRVIKDNGRCFRIEFRLSYLYCDFDHLINVLIYNFMNKFKDIKSCFNYLTYSSKRQCELII